MRTTATEVVIALQFNEPLPHLNALQLAAIVAEFPEFPVFAELSVSGPMAYSLEQLDGSEQLPPFTPTFPRIGLTSLARNRTLAFQGDRLTLSWLRTTDIGESTDYPGFDKLCSEAMPIFRRFAATVVLQADVDVVPKVAEITYVNILPTRTADDEVIRLSTLFSFIKPIGNAPGIHGYFHGWNERLGVANGVLRLQVNGPVVYAPGKPAANFTLAGAFLIADTAHLDEELLSVRQRISESYNRVLGLGSDR